MSERDYTKAPFNFDLPGEPVEIDWLDPFLDSIPLEQGVTEKKPGDLFRDIRHGHMASFSSSTQDQLKQEKKSVIKYGKLNWSG